jgi:hypothetical protein
MRMQAEVKILAFAYVRTVSSVARAPSSRPSVAVDSQATGLPFRSSPSISQSSRFFSEPGRVPAYSGVQKSTASEARTRCRSQLTVSGA